MSKQNPKAKESEGPAWRMECHRSKGGSSKSMAAKEVTKTQAGWENASKALVKEESVKTAIKEESVNGTIPIKRKNWRSVNTGDFVCSVKIFLKSQKIFDQKLEIETLNITYIYWEYSKESLLVFPIYRKKVLEITKKYDPLKICTMGEMKNSHFTHSTEISYKKNMHNSYHT